MAITIIQRQKRRKLLFAGFVIIAIALISIIYFVSRPASPAPPAVPAEIQISPAFSERLKKLKINWEFLEDERLQSLKKFPDSSVLIIEEPGRENPFSSY